MQKPSGFRETRNFTDLTAFWQGEITVFEKESLYPPQIPKQPSSPDEAQRNPGFVIPFKNIKKSPDYVALHPGYVHHKFD